MIRPLLTFRLRGRAILAALASCFVLDGAFAQQDKPGALPEESSFASARELLQTIGVDESHFRMFLDGQPVDLSEQEPLLRMLYAVRRCPPQEIERFARADFRQPAAGEESDELRGEIFRLEGEVSRVAPEQPLAEVVDRYQMKQYYRCQVLLGPSRQPATVFALSVPKAWPLDEEFSERISCAGFYLKLAPGETAEAEAPVFATQRLAWHPAGLLGDLKMDFGLFDMAQNKSPILREERECFYQLLAAVGRANPRELFQLTERPPDDDYSVVPLFNAPEAQHGKLFALTGTARRALLVKLDPQREAAEIRRLGADHYYQVEIFTQDSQGNPLVFCVRELPAGMPQGPEIYETVRIPGFFFKTWAYRLQPSEGQPEPGHQLAPMLVGNQLQWIKVETGRSPLVGALAGGFFLLALSGAWLAVWAYNRGDRKFHQRVLAKRHEPLAGQSLNEMNIQAQEPDFRNLP